MFLNNDEHTQHMMLSLTRKRSVVRIHYRPLYKLLQITGKSKRPGEKTGPFYTNFYTSALRKRLLHSGNGTALHVGQHMRVSVERYRYSRVAQHFRDDLWVNVLKQQYGRGGVPELVERHWRKTGAL